MTQSGVVPAQRNRAPPCQIDADAAFLEPLKTGLKVLTHPLKDLLGSDSRPVFLLSIISGTHQLPIGSPWSGMVTTFDLYFCQPNRSSSSTYTLGGQSPPEV
jgi:hypothetical protein